MSRVLRLLIVVLIVAAAWILVLPARGVDQPIAFNHAKHGQLGCVACHDGARAGTRAGIPQGGTCLKCHATAPASVKAAVWDGVASGRRIGWARITRTADHVLFSHRRHVTVGRLQCVSCHGEIATSQRPPVRASIRLDMDGCMSCHKREGGSEDCIACHR
ncbi:MAG: cytochrome c3 family protein [Acidobacteria bacterium]|nr:cytochrome c3 family protein [Acidobacteriota bacterium]